jgi:hypothetical protein
MVARRSSLLVPFVVGSVGVAGCPAAPDVAVIDERPDVPLPVDCDITDTAAVPVLPRTSNDEVRRLVEDLAQAPVDPALFATWTPLAQVRGFDTMTESRIDAQTLDAQFDTMAAVAAQLVNDPRVMAACPAAVVEAPVCTVHARYDATAQFSPTQGQDCWSYLDGNGALLTYDDANQRFVAADPGLFLWNTGMHPGINVDVIRRFTAPTDGSVVVGGSAFDADPGGGDGVSIVIRAPSGVVLRAPIANGGAADAWNIPLVLRRGEVVDLVVERGESNAYDTTGVSVTVDFAAAPSTANLSWENCGAGVVNAIASRAWRRPLRAGEGDSLKQVFDEVLASATSTATPGAFHDALAATLQAVLLSPNLHYKSEFVPGGFDDDEDGYRIASRLALYFRGSFADDELMALAAADALRDNASIRAQAARLLDENLDRFVEHFAGQWLDFRAPAGGVAQTALQQSMRNEAHDVFAAVVEDGATPERLFAPGFTIVDGPLAAHYGLPLDPAAGATRIDTAERGGLFTQGHMLTSTATGSDFKRVINRGIWTLNRALCTSVPELDPATREEINNSVGAIPPGTPLAEQMEIHRNSSGRCLACHGEMDPLGLALEAFDAQGLRRTAYADGSDVDNDFDFHGVALPNPESLAAFVSTSSEYNACVSEKLLTFGLHRAPRDAERCLVDGLGRASDGTSRTLKDITLDAFVASLRLTETP